MRRDAAIRAIARTSRMPISRTRDLARAPRTAYGLRADGVVIRGRRAQRARTKTALGRRWRRARPI